jgi:hypothetical protein
MLFSPVILPADYTDDVRVTNGNAAETGSFEAASQKACGTESQRKPNALRNRPAAGSHLPRSLAVFFREAAELQQILPISC